VEPITPLPGSWITTDDALVQVAVAAGIAPPPPLPGDDTMTSEEVLGAIKWRLLWLWHLV
jgi:hypothetical protein